MVCFIPSPGETIPHLAKGMVQPFAVAAGGVTQAGGAAAAFAPTPEIHLALKDFAFALSKPLTAGKHVIHVMNEGTQDHEAVFVKLAPGKHVTDFGTYIMTGMKGESPATAMDGMASMSKGRTAMFTANLTPGRYALICFAPDAKTGKAHMELGMTSEFEVK